MKSVFAFILLSSFVFAEEEEGLRDKLVRNAQRVERAVTKDLGSLREKGCQALKGTECIPPEKIEEKKDEVPAKTN
jgi:hypothetical protein